MTAISVACTVLSARVRPEARILCDRGATAVEYALMIGGIAAVIILAVGNLGFGVNELFDSFLSEIPWR